MSLTSYRAAPPRVNLCCKPRPTNGYMADQLKGPLTRPVIPWRALFIKRRFQRAFGRPGSDLLSRVLRRSTISAGAFHGRVRNGIGCSRSAITTRSAKRTLFEKLFERRSTRDIGSGAVGCLSGLFAGLCCASHHSCLERWA